MKLQQFDFYNPANLNAYNLGETMKYQLSMLDRMDVFTRKHSENVANLTCRICEYLHCKRIFTVHAIIDGYLHDIGKLAIPPEILNKPGKLTEEEFEIMKTHTTLGYEMCMRDLKLRPYAEGPLYHHESLNGTGYPQGLTDKDIPYAVQIVRVADEYDAIVTKRQYKTHINISETLKELIKDARPDDYKPAVALDMLMDNKKKGKIDPRALNALFKVVIDDTLYEIYSVEEYLKYLKRQIKRLEQIAKYDEKRLKQKSEKKAQYFLNGMEVLFDEGETVDNYKVITQDYRNALTIREDVRRKLYDEINIIKKLKIYG